MLNLPSFPPEMDEAAIRAMLADNGYEHVRQLPDGTWAGLTRLIFTTGLCVGMDDLGWAARYCFEQYDKALLELACLQSIHQTPQGFIAQRGTTDFFKGANHE